MGEDYWCLQMRETGTDEIMTISGGEDVEQLKYMGKLLKQMYCRNEETLTDIALVRCIVNQDPKIEDELINIFVLDDEYNWHHLPTWLHPET